MLPLGVGEDDESLDSNRQLCPRLNAAGHPRPGREYNQEDMMSEGFEPAFPTNRADTYKMGCRCGRFVEYPDSPGMALRDWFAGMALQGIVSRSAADGLTMEHKVQAAYEYADALLAERTRRT